jgi:hypothetical protein
MVDKSKWTTIANIISTGSGMAALIPGFGWAFGLVGGIAQISINIELEWGPFGVQNPDDPDPDFEKEPVLEIFELPPWPDLEAPAFFHSIGYTSLKDAIESTSYLKSYRIAERRYYSALMAGDKESAKNQNSFATNFLKEFEFRLRSFSLNMLRFSDALALDEIGSKTLEIETGYTQYQNELKKTGSLPEFEQEAVKLLGLPKHIESRIIQRCLLIPSAKVVEIFGRTTTLSQIYRQLSDTILEYANEVNTIFPPLETKKTPKHFEDYRAGTIGFKSGSAGITVSLKKPMPQKYSVSVQPTNTSGYSPTKEATYFNVLKKTSTDFQVQHKRCEDGVPVALDRNISLDWIAWSTNT